ncbi:MAG: hypothetical protein AAGI07_14135 [Bacteroidota bacterium]
MIEQDGIWAKDMYKLFCWLYKQNQQDKRQSRILTIGKLNIKLFVSRQTNHKIRQGGGRNLLNRLVEHQQICNILNGLEYQFKGV